MRWETELGLSIRTKVQGETFVSENGRSSIPLGLSGHNEFKMLSH